MLNAFVLFINLPPVIVSLLHNRQTVSKENELLMSSDINKQNIKLDTKLVIK